MALMAKLILSFTGPMTVGEFERQCRHPRAAQVELLRQILQKNKDTVFGRKYGFSRIKTMRTFQKRVPISTYEDLKPFIDAELRGKKGQLTAEKPILFALTSGTTGDAKYIPVTPECRKAKADLMNVWLSAFFGEHPDIFSERILSVVSPEMTERSPDGTPCGAESGHAYRNAPAPIRALYACPYEVFEIEDYEARYYTVLRIAAAQSLSLIVTVNPSTILILCERLAKHTRAIIRDVREGGLSSDIHVPRRIRERIADWLLPNPVRAEELERLALQHGNRLAPRLIWPKLAAVACWQGGTVGEYIEKLKPYFPAKTPFRDIGYLASEHRGSVPLFDDTDVGVLAIATNVYEFSPADKKRKPHGPELLTVSDLKLNQRYYVYVTTRGGLYRYDMADIVEVVAYYQRTPMIRFVQKGKGIVSITGEKLSEAQVLEAVREAFGGVRGGYEFISAVAQRACAPPRYVLLAEFVKPPAPSRLQKMVRAVDERLSALNGEYASKRASARLGPLSLRIVKRGEFDRYRRRKVSEGRADSQFKILRVTDDECFANEFKIVRGVELKSNSGAKPKRNVSSSRRSRLHFRKMRTIG